MKLLHIDSSILGTNSVSRRLSAAIAGKLKEQNPGIEVVYYDLAADPLPHLSGALFAAQAKAPAERTAEEQSYVTRSAEALEQFMAADILVIGAPMYNYTISTQLKAWIDRIAVAGKTFKYTADGSVGLAGGKKVFIASSRGGIYSEGPVAIGGDFQEPYLRILFGFLGITDLEYIRAEGVALGPDSRQKAIADAEAEIERRDYALAA